MIIIVAIGTTIVMITIIVYYSITTYYDLGKFIVQYSMYMAIMLAS